MNPFNQYGPDYISSLNNSYRDAELRKNKSVHLMPEGKYQALISQFALRSSKTYQDELYLSLGFEVIDGPEKGHTAYKNYPIVPEYIGKLKNDLAILGIDLRGDIRTLGEPDTANMIIDLIVDITIKHRQNNDRTFQNVYLDRLVGKAEDQFVEVRDDEELPWERGDT